MPDKKGRISGQERRFVETYVATGDGTYAAEKAGYTSPRPRASQNLAKPAIQAEIRQAQLARLHNKLLPLAFDHFEDVLTSRDAPLREKTMVASKVVDVTKGLVEDTGTKEPADMTPEELERARQQLLGELAARSKPVIEHEEQSVFD